MNKLEIVHKVKAHLLAQGEPARSERNSKMSVYRNSKNQSCAVGCLVSDEVAKSWGMDNCDPVINLAEDFKLPEWMLDYVPLLSRLQYIHDKYKLENNNWEQYINENFDVLEKNIL